MSSRVSSSSSSDESIASEMTIALRKMRDPTAAELDTVAHALAGAFNSTLTNSNPAHRVHYAFLGGYWRTKLLDGPQTTSDIDCLISSNIRRAINALKPTGKFAVGNPGAEIRRMYYVFPYSPTGTPVGTGDPSTGFAEMAPTELVKTHFIVKVELLTAGTFGPREITSENVQQVQVGTQGTLPFLKPSEFIRTKVGAWGRRADIKDFNDVHATMVKYNRDFTATDLERLLTGENLNDMLQTLNEEPDKTAETAAKITELDGILTRLHQQQHPRHQHSDKCCVMF